MHYARWRLYGDVSDDHAFGNVSDFKRRRALMAKIRVDELGCWVWTGTKTAEGYGQMRVGGRRRDYTHRVSYQLHKGPIPEGLAIDHLCKNRACANPEHLEAVHPRINAMRGDAPGIVAYRTNRCKRNHEFTPENTITVGGRWRRCRTCENAWQRERRAKKKAAVNAMPVGEPNPHPRTPPSSRPA